MKQVKGKDNVKAMIQDTKYARDTFFIRTPPACTSNNKGGSSFREPPPQMSFRYHSFSFVDVKRR
jgi:hypothetical protein